MTCVHLTSLDRSSPSLSSLDCTWLNFSWLDWTSVPLAWLNLTWVHLSWVHLTWPQSQSIKKDECEWSQNFANRQSLSYFSNLWVCFAAKKKSWKINGFFFSIHKTIRSLCKKLERKNMLKRHDIEKGLILQSFWALAHYSNIWSSQLTSPRPLSEHP